MKTIEDLYDGLFVTLESLQTGKIKPEEAMAVAAVAQTIINAAKVECEYAKINKARGTHFIPTLAPIPKTPAIEPPKPEPEPVPTITREPQDLHLTNVDGYEVGDRVFLPSGKHGTVQSVTAAGRINVETESGILPYSAKHLSHATEARAPIRSPIVPQGSQARFVPGRNASGSR